MLISKKIVCFTALLLANITLLVHAAVPHHYHENTGVCFIAHCTDSKEMHHHEEDSGLQTHQHDGNPFSDTCHIDNVYTAASSNTRITCCLHLKCACEQMIYQPAVNTLNTQNFIAYTAIHFQPKPCLHTYHGEYIAQSLGLRAPPTL